MNVLGISCYYHDSAAALMSDGKIIAAVEEERFSRTKFDDDYPRCAIDWCLAEAKINTSQLDTIAFYDKPIVKFERLIDNYITVAPRGMRSFMNVIPKWIHKRLWIRSEIKKHLKDFSGDIVFPDHHTTHAAHSFYTSRFEEAAFLTVDGVGEWATTSFGQADQNKIKILGEIHWPHSLGLFYSAFTYFCGFAVNEGEYKLMGLSAYGKPRFYDIILKELIDIKPDGSFRLNQKYFSYTHDLVMTNQKFSDLFGISVRGKDSKMEQVYYDIAASAQLVLEDVLLKMVNHLHKKTNSKNLCLGGGVALNGVANYRIIKEGPFEKVHIPPAPGDAGSAAGAAQYVYYLNNPRKIIQDRTKWMAENMYLGPSYSDDQILEFLRSKKIEYRQLPTAQLLAETAQMIADGLVVGWFQGRMEWGPRALGNRSILADPRRAEMKDILNEKIKHREGFRPFAPSILEEYASEYFEIDTPSPYMLLVAPIKKPEKIPAVTHVDGTGRLQTVSAGSNPLYYSLISEFFQLSGVPVIINTSMNVRGEPIVNTPAQAYGMLQKTDMDALVMGSFVVRAKT